MPPCGKPRKISNSNGFQLETSESCAREGRGLPLNFAVKTSPHLHRKMVQGRERLWKCHPLAPGHAHNFSLVLIPAARRGWDRTVLQMRQVNLKGLVTLPPHIWNRGAPSLDTVILQTSHEEETFLFCSPTIYPGIMPCVQCVSTVFRMNEYERRVGTWSDSQPRLLCVTLRVLYKTAGNSAMWISSKR